MGGSGNVSVAFGKIHTPPQWTSPEETTTVNGSPDPVGFEVSVTETAGSWVELGVDWSPTANNPPGLNQAVSVPTKIVLSDAVPYISALRRKDTWGAAT